MNSGEQLSDDDLGLRGEARRTASALLKLAVLAGIAAGGVWAYARVEKRRTVRKQTAAEVKAAIDRLAAGTWFRTRNDTTPPSLSAAPPTMRGSPRSPLHELREIDATAARVTNDGLRHLAKPYKAAPSADSRPLVEANGPIPTRATDMCQLL